MTRPDPPYPKYPEWDDKERWAAQRALNCALEVLEEFDY